MSCQDEKPSQAEIAKMTARIREGWSEYEMTKRAGEADRPPLTVQICKVVVSDGRR